MTASQLLLETARRGELHHAVILHGPSLEDLRQLAIRISKTLNCLQGTTGDDCLSCSRIERLIHPDVHIVEVGGERKLISIEQVRNLVSGSAMRPYEGRNKVYIIDPADALSISGSNALLKTLEEPVRDTTFILLTRSPDLLLPTIRSRSQSIYVGGKEPFDGELRDLIVAELKRFAEKGESVALLAIAAAVAQRESVNDAIALLGSVLCEAAAGELAETVPRERILAAASGANEALKWLPVNADPRMLVESALAELVGP
jgi:DNA polymerase III gamma/tau subunit